MDHLADTVVCPNCASAAEFRPAPDEESDVETMIVCPSCKFEAPPRPRPYEDRIQELLDQSEDQDRS